MLVTRSVLLTAVLASCALPDIHRGDAPDGSTASRADAAALTGTLDAAAKGYDPEWDPANRNEDFETFQTLVPEQHRFAELCPEH